MSSAKRTASTLLIVGSILLLVFSVIQMIYGLRWGFYDVWNFISWISYLLLLPASILVLVGVIKYRSSLPPQMIGQPMFMQPPTAVPQTSTRICPKCGRMVNENVQFCPHCGNNFG